MKLVERTWTAAVSSITAAAAAVSLCSRPLSLSSLSLCLCFLSPLATTRRWWPLS
ncbi:hypothetical protein Hanom_Chr06g00569291 [Helianthus anomalus]